MVTGFGCYEAYLDSAQDSDFEGDASAPAEKALLVKEARVACVMGMLLCLDREQRVIFLLGEILETSDRVGAELLDLSPDNFRQRLARARAQLSSFMRGRCSLVSPGSPCRCVRKTAAFIRDGIVDAAQIRFATGHLKDVTAIAGDRERELRGLLDLTRTELREVYPLFDAPDVVARLSSLLQNGALGAALRLS